jgi:predicted dehydrogenase
MAAPVGWGIVGCSDIVRKRAGAAIVAQEQSRLVAFAARDIARAREFAAHFGAETAYDDMDSFLRDERITCVYVATEVERHANLAIAAARAGKHVLVEKPMALDTAECLAMIGAADRHGVRLAVAYYCRFFEKARLMKQVIEEGRLGTVVRANVRVLDYYDPPPAHPQAWRVTARGGGNRLADIGSHRLDLLVYFLGRPLLVAGLADRLSMTYEAPDTETALIRFEGGAHVTAMASANVPHAASSTSLEIYGTRGALLTDPWSDDPVAVLGSDDAPLAATRPANAHFPMIDDFARAIVEGRPPRFSGPDGLWATAIIEGVYQSARDGCAVTLPPLASGG